MRMSRPRHISKRTRPNHSEAGNVFLFILIGIVLFATISFVMSRGFRSEGTSGISARQADLMATRIIDYSSKLQSGVDRALRNGCSEQELNFLEVYTITNPTAPPDGKCNIFQRHGGPVKFWDTLNERSNMLAIEEAPTASYYQRQFFIGGPMRHAGAGDGNTVDLIMFLPDIADALCISINRQLGIVATNGSIPDSTARRLGGNQFAGTFDPTGALAANRNIVDVNGNITDHMIGCVRTTNDTGSHTFNTFYAVLIAR